MKMIKTIWLKICICFLLIPFQRLYSQFMRVSLPFTYDAKEQIFSQYRSAKEFGSNLFNGKNFKGYFDNSYYSNFYFPYRGDEFLVDTTIHWAPAANAQGAPAIAFDGNNYLVVWEDYRNGSDYDIYATRVTPQGIVIDSMGILVSKAPFDQRYPAVAFDGTNYFVVWQDYRYGSPNSAIVGARVTTSGVVLDSNGIQISSAYRAGGPSVAFDGINYLVVWHDLSWQRGENIYGARVSTDGTVLDPPVPICNAQNDQYWPAVAFDGTNYFVVWHDYRDTTSWNIYGARVTPSGNVIDTNGFLIYVSNKDQLYPKVVFGGGYYFIAWQNFHNIQDSFNIYGIRVTPSGVVIDTNGIPISTAANSQKFPVVDFDGTNYMVVWQDFRDSSYKIYGARVNINGMVLDSSGIPISTFGSEHLLPFLKFGNGRYFFAWSTEGISDRDIYGVRMNPNGTIVDSTDILISMGPNTQKNPCCEFDGLNYLIVWTDNKNNSWDIYGVRIDSSGNILDFSPIPITNLPSNQSSPSITFDGTNYFVVWNDDRNGTWDIYGSRITPSGVVIDPNGIPISTVIGDQITPSVAFDGTNYLVVWQDRRNGNWDIYGARVTPSGNVLDPDGIPISIESHRQTAPYVTFGSSMYLVVWVDRRGSYDDIYGARVTPSGTVLDPDGIPISTASFLQWAPHADFDGERFFVVWEDWRSGVHILVYGARVDTLGNVLDPSGIRLSSLIYPYYQGTPFVRFDGKRHFIVWDGRWDTPSYDIYGVKVDTTGSVVGSLIISSQEGHQRSPAVAIGNNQKLVAYTGFTDSINTHRINTMRIWCKFIYPTLPSAPELINPSHNSNTNNTQISFIWHHSQDTVGIQYYVLQYAIDKSFSQGLVETTLTDTICTVILTDTTYYWHVKAVDNLNNSSDWSERWCFTIDTHSPNTPSLITPIGGVFLGDTNVTFEWTQVNYSRVIKSLQKNSGGIFSSPVRYILEIDTLLSFVSPVKIDTFDTNTTILPISLEDKYYWRVKAFDLAGNQGSYSDIDSFGVDITPPLIESTTLWMDTSFNGPFEIKTKVWDGLAGVDSVVLHYKRMEDPNWISSVMNTSGLWFVDTIPEVTFTNDTVKYYIEALDEATPPNIATDPLGAPINYYSFIALEINENEGKYGTYWIKIHSLSHNKLLLDFYFPLKSHLSLSLYDVTGRQILKWFIRKPLSGNHKVQLSLPKKGVYFYKYQSLFGSKRGKIIVF